MTTAFYTSAFIKNLPDDHPCSSYESFVSMLHSVINSLAVEPNLLNEITQSIVTDWPWVNDISDFENLTIPYRDFDLDLTSILDNLVDFQFTNNNFTLTIEPEQFIVGFNNFRKNIEYRDSLVKYVFRMYLFDHDQYPNAIIIFLIIVRSQGFAFRNPLRIIEMEIRILEHFAYWPHNIDYLMTLFTDNPNFLTPLANAVDSDWCAWKFPPYKCVERYQTYVDENLMDRSYSPSDFETQMFQQMIGNMGDGHDLFDYDYSHYDAIDDWWEHASRYSQYCSHTTDDVTIVCHDTHLEFLMEYPFEEYFDPYVGIQLLFMSEYDFYLYVHAQRLDAWCDSNIKPLEFVSLYETAVPQMKIPVFTDLTDSINNMTDSVDDFIEKLPDKEERLDWQKVFTNLGSSLDSTSSVFSAFSSLTSLIPGSAKARDTSEKMKEAFKNVTSRDQGDTLFMCMFASFIYYLRYRTWVGVSLFALFWLPLCLYDSKLFKTTAFVWIYIGANLPTSLDVEDESEVAVPQMSNDEFNNSVEVVSSLFLGYLSLEKTKDTQSAILAFLKDFSKVKGGAVDIAKTTFRFSENLINICLEQATGKAPMFRFFSTSYTLYDEYFTEVRSFCSRYNNHQIHASQEVLSNLASLIEAGRKIKLGLPRDPSSREISNFLQQDLQSLRKIQVSLEQQNISFTGFRQEPVVVEFKGPTSVGKSVAMTNANYATVARHFTGAELEAFKKQPSTKIHTCVPENEYMDGFNSSHWIVNIDDFGQGRDIVGNVDNEYMKLIRFVNGFEYYPHMAELENKGKVTFQAPYIFLNTNIRDHQPVSLAQPAAFKRRIHFSYIVVPKHCHTTPESRNKDLWNRVLDSSTLPVDSATNVTTMDDIVHDYYVLDNQTSEPTGEVISFTEVMVRCFAKYDKNKSYFEQNLKTFNATLDKYHELFHPSIPVSDDEDCQMEEVYEEDITGLRPGHGKYQQLIFKYLTHRRARALITHYLPDLDYDPSILADHLVMIELCLLEKGIDCDRFKLLIEDDTQRLLPVYSVVKFRRKVSIFTWIKEYFYEKLKLLSDKFPILLRFKDFVSNHGYDIVMTVIRFAIGFAIGHYIQKFLIKIFCSREFYDEVYPQSHNEGDKMRSNKSTTKLYKNSTAMKDFVRSHPVAQSQMGSDSNGQDIIASIVKSNHFSISKKNITESSDEYGNTKEVVTWDHLGYFLVLRERVAIMNYHYIMTLSNGLYEDPSRLDVQLKISRNGKSRSEVSYYISVREILEKFEYRLDPDVSGGPPQDRYLANLSKKDLVLVELPSRVQPCRDITEYIVSEKNLMKDSLQIEGLLANANKSFFAWTTILDRPLNVVDEFNNESWFLREGYRYHAITVNGDCGSIFAKMDSSIAKEKIYGLHCSGGMSSNYGYASSFTQEEIRGALEAFYPLVEEAAPQLDWSQFNNFVIEGPIANPPVVPTRSGIAKSPIFDVIKQHTTLPTKLFQFKNSKGEVIDPWEVALKNYDIDTPPISDSTWKQVERAANQYFNMLHDTMIRRYEPRVFTLEEAIHGVSGDENFGPIPSGTSAGYPMNVQGNDNLKKLLFTADRNSPEYLNILERIREEVELAEVTYAAGDRPEFYYVDYLKDERKKIEKVREGKTRMFSGGPLILFILFRKHFGWFDSHFKSNKIQNWSAIGVNPFSEEWDHIAKFLGEVTSEEILAGAGDYSKFDASHLAIIHIIMVNLICKVYYPNATPREIAIKTGLFSEIHSSNHIFLGIVVKWFKGMPSGNALTAIINTVYNAICLCFVFICVIDEHPELGLKDIQCTESLRACILGDDNCFSTIPKLIPYYNELTLPKYLSRIGMTYTTELKETAVIPFRPITEISFLKRSWVYCPMSGRYIAPLELDVVLEFSMWTKKGTDYFNISATNFENTLNELSLHSCDTWDRYYPTLLKAACREYSFHKWNLPLLTPWDVRRQNTLKSISFY